MASSVDVSTLGSFFVPDGVPTASALERVTTLAVGAHQDDIEFFGMHAVLENFATRSLAGVVCTDGGGSPRCGPYADFTYADMTAVRVREQNRAAAVGQYSCMWQLGATSADAKSAASRATSLVPQLLAILRATRPRTLYTHNPADKHDTHVSCLIAVLTAVRMLAKHERPTLIYGCEVWRDLDWLCDEDRIMLDVSSNPQLSKDIIAVFDSQINGGKRYDDAVLGRRAAHATFFSTHTLDFATALQFAMDLTPLAFDGVPDDGASGEGDLPDAMTRFILAKVDRLRDNIADRIRRHA